MPTGSGLDAQLGLAAESTWGTAVTPTRFVEFNSESLRREPTYLEPTGLRAGTKFKRAPRVRVSRTSVSGDVTMELSTKGMLLLLKHALGASVSAPTVITAPAYRTIFTPGDYRGLGLTVQVGRPEPSTGLVRLFTYRGCKVAKWELSIADGATPTLTLTLDGRAEDTAAALATASYPAGASVFDFSQASLKLGGTASTTAGLMTVAAGTAVATVVKQLTIGGTTGMDTERFGLGNAGLKSEPLENTTPMITGNLSAEFSRDELYALHATNATFPLQVSLAGDPIGASGSNFLFDVILSAAKLKSAPPSVDGPGIVQMSSDFEGYADGTNAPLQLVVQSDESAF